MNINCKNEELGNHLEMIMRVTRVNMHMHL